MSDVPTVARERDHALKAIFGRADDVLIGVVHLLPLPGSPDHRGSDVEPIYDRAFDDARAYAAAGFDGLIVENHGDIPFAKPDDIGPETAAHMAVASDRIRRDTRLPIGVNVLANAALHALGLPSPPGRASCASINGRTPTSPMKGLSRAQRRARPAIAANSGRTGSAFSPTRMSSTARMP
jgi:hypothetical protein